MNIIKAGCEIVNKENINGLDILKRIEKIGRVCYKSEDAITEDGESAKRFVSMLIKNKHEAMLENGDNISVLFTVDRGVTHELVRHRLSSFAQESTRYCNYSKGKYNNEISVIDIRTGLALNKKVEEWADIEAIIAEWCSAMEDAERHYMKMLELGATTEIARSVLPNSTKANITVTANIREWRHILNLRAAGITGTPHPQMLEVAVPLLIQFHELMPVLFDDVYATAEENGYIKLYQEAESKKKD